MESQPQNPEFRTNPENFHPCYLVLEKLYFRSYQSLLAQFLYPPTIPVWDMSSICPR